MASRVVSIALVAILGGLLWLFAGVERIEREHTTDYHFFAKQSPSFQIVFENPAMCGECDLRPWDLLKPDERRRFAEYCAVRFGLNDLRPCYAIFETEQRVTTERLRPSVR
jgi:hypothetical protein